MYDLLSVPKFIILKTSVYLLLPTGLILWWFFYTKLLFSLFSICELFSLCQGVVWSNENSSKSDYKIYSWMNITGDRTRKLVVLKIIVHLKIGHLPKIGKNCVLTLEIKIRWVHPNKIVLSCFILFVGRGYNLTFI